MLTQDQSTRLAMASMLDEDGSRNEPKQSQDERSWRERSIWYRILHPPVHIGTFVHLVDGKLYYIHHGTYLPGQETDKV